MTPAIVRRIIRKVTVRSVSPSRIIDFHDRRRVRWFIMFDLRTRDYGPLIILSMRGSYVQNRDDLRDTLLSLVPPEITAQLLVEAINYGSGG